MLYVLRQNSIIQIYRNSHPLFGGVFISSLFISVFLTTLMTLHVPETMFHQMVNIISLLFNGNRVEHWGAETTAGRDAVYLH